MSDFFPDPGEAALQADSALLQEREPGPGPIHLAGGSSNRRIAPPTESFPMILLALWNISMIRVVRK